MSDALTGLTSADVAERVADGRTNDVPDAPVRSNLQIIQANVLTPVNGIISTLFVLILVAGYPADALAGVVVSNSVIGIAQEFQARRTLTELAVLSAPKARVRRDGETTEVGVSEVVADDVLELSPGDQVVVDGDVLAESGLELMSRCSPARAIRSRKRSVTPCCRVRSCRPARVSSSHPHRRRVLCGQALRRGSSLRTRW